MLAPARTESPGPAARASSPAVDRYLAAARAAGCPRDQIERFLRAGIVLQPRQLAMSAAARECDVEGGPTEVGVGGARAGGKSHWGFGQICADDCQRFAGLKALILRQVGKAARESVEDLRLRLLKNLKHQWARQEGLISFPNGSRVLVGHFHNERDIDAYLGLEYDLILVEEATTLTATKYRQIRTCCRSSKLGWRPRLYTTTNPGGVGHTWYKSTFVEPFRRGEESTTRFIPATVRDNLFVNREYRAFLEALVGWERRAWLEGDWDIAAGQFFSNWRRDLNGQPHHVIPPFDVPADWRTWAALDYGFTHYTCVHLLAQSGDGDVYVLDEHCQRRWLPERHADAIRAMLGRQRFTWQDANGEQQVGCIDLDFLDRFVAGADVFTRDRSGRTTADTYKDLGITLSAARTDRVNGASEILSRLGDSEAGIAPRLFVFDRCARLIETMPAMQHDPNRPEDVLKVDADEDGSGGDDAYDCVRYGVMEAYRPPANAVKRPGARRRDRFGYA